MGPELPIQGAEESRDRRQFWVATLVDKFQMCECPTASIRDVKTRIEERKALEGMICLTEEGSDAELQNSMTLAELPNDTTLTYIIRGIETVESKLSNLPSPGCAMQKYLRWLEGVPAEDQRVLQSLWLISILSTPAEVAEMPPDPEEEQQLGSMEDHLGPLPRDEVDAAVILGHAQLWRPCPSKEPISGDLDGLSLNRMVKVTRQFCERLEKLTWDEIQRALEQHYRLTSHCHLLEWILEEGSPRLRVAMAEVEQILVRGAVRFVQGANADAGSKYRSDDRQSGSFKSLLAIANCEPNLYCWA